MPYKMSKGHKEENTNSQWIDQKSFKFLLTRELKIQNWKYCLAYHIDKC